MLTPPGSYSRNLEIPKREFRRGHHPQYGEFNITLMKEISAEIENFMAEFCRMLGWSDLTR